MRVDVLSLFPELIEKYSSTSILKLAQEQALLEVHAHNPRDFSTDKHKKVDDICYGGGAGMLLSPQPFVDCLDSVLQDLKLEGLQVEDLKQGQLEHPQERDYEIIITSPAGETLDQKLAQELSTKSNLIMLCGRYEGFDERIKNLATREISLGDFVLTGGELAALTILDASARLIPGVLGDDQSNIDESFSSQNYLEILKELKVSKRELEDFVNRCDLDSIEELRDMQLLEYPHYTRPKDFRGQKVPLVLESGDHKAIALWRLEQAIKATRLKRKDLLT